MKKSLYAQYIKEREDKQVIEYEQGFIKFSFGENETFGKHCYIEDIFVTEENRDKHLASKMADQVKEIAKGKGCEFLVGSVDTTTNGVERSIKVLYSYGFTIKCLDGQMIYFSKEL